MPERRPHILVPILRAQAAPALLEVAEAVRSREETTGHLLGVVEIPAGREIAKSVTVARRFRGLLQRISGMAGRESSGFGVQVRVGHNLAQAVREAAFENGSGLIVLEWPGLGRRRATGTLDGLIVDPPADLLLVRPETGARRHGADRILVPVRGGPSAALALRTAAALARNRRATLTVMHVYEPRLSAEQRAEERRRFEDALQVLGRQRRQVIEIESGTPGAAIREQAEKHSITVLGAYADATRSSVVVSLRLADTVRRLPGTVVVAKSAASVPVAWDYEEAPTILRQGDIQNVVDRWFAENTFHSREFRDVDRLVRLKREQGLSISLGLPTLNEESTIGNIIETMQEALVERSPLLDEIVVIDSGSTDETVSIARSLGVRVHPHMDVLPEYGTYRGKGEALWKSVHLLSGDIVVWCDTDISNIHPQFVYGTVGPILTDPRIGYVKGFYRRPLNFGGEVQTAGGGRVTELTARPIINLFYPELSGLLQPLSGEYAARRLLLERLPFFTGYGVEIGHLIDVLESFGLNRIAQTDLGVRIHRNQDLFNLSKMAFAIMQVAVKRLGDRHRMHLLEDINRTMKLIHYNEDRFFLELKDIGDWERPPMRTIPEYLARRQELLASPAERQQEGVRR